MSVTFAGTFLKWMQTPHGCVRLPFAFAVFENPPGQSRWGPGKRKLILESEIFIDPVQNL